MGGKSKRRYMLGLIYLKKLLQTVMVTVTEKVMMLCRESHICSPKFAEARFNRSYFNKLNRTRVVVSLSICCLGIRSHSH